MTEEQKQALIWRCRDAVAHLKQVVEVGIRGGRYSVTEYRYQLMINEIALAALTAQPVKLPSASEPHSSGYGCAYMVETKGGEWLEKSEVKAAIRAAGYEVQE